MSKVMVQCAGTGMQVNAGLNAKRAPCPRCHRTQDLTSAGRIRRHDVRRRKSSLK